MMLSSTYTSAVQKALEPWLLFLADDPMLRALQGGLLLLGFLVIFTVFFATRDILLRTQSFLLMFFCIILVAFLPIVGFFLYLLIRPSQTIAERTLARQVDVLYAVLNVAVQGQKSGKKTEKKREKEA